MTDINMIRLATALDDVGEHIASDIVISAASKRHMTKEAQGFGDYVGGNISNLLKTVTPMVTDPAISKLFQHPEFQKLPIAVQRWLAQNMGTPGVHWPTSMLGTPENMSDAERQKYFKMLNSKNPQDYDPTFKLKGMNDLLPESYMRDYSAGERKMPTNMMEGLTNDVGQVLAG